MVDLNAACIHLTGAYHTLATPTEELKIRAYTAARCLVSALAMSTDRPEPPEARRTLWSQAHSHDTQHPSKV